MSKKKFCEKWGHDTYTIVDDELATVERCKECSTRLIYKKIDGKIDNKRYLREHYRDYIQHGSKDFHRFYDSREYQKRQDEQERDKQRIIDENNQKIEDYKRKEKRNKTSTGKLIW